MSDTETHERFAIKAFDGEIEATPIGARRIRFTCNGPQNVDPAPRVIVNNVALLFDLFVDVDEKGKGVLDQRYIYITRAGAFTNKDAPAGARKKLIAWAELAAGQWFQDHAGSFGEAECVNLRNGIAEGYEAIRVAQEQIDKQVRIISDLSDQLDELT